VQISRADTDTGLLSQLTDGGCLWSLTRLDAAADTDDLAGAEAGLLAAQEQVSGRIAEDEEAEGLGLYGYQLSRGLGQSTDDLTGTAQRLRQGIEPAASSESPVHGAVAM